MAMRNLADRAGGAAAVTAVAAELTRRVRDDAAAAEVFAEGGDDEVRLAAFVACVFDAPEADAAQLTAGDHAVNDSAYNALLAHLDAAMHSVGLDRLVIAEAYARAAALRSQIT